MCARIISILALSLDLHILFTTDIWIVYVSFEGNFRLLKRIILGKEHLKFEYTTLIKGSNRTYFIVKLPYSSN